MSLGRWTMDRLQPQWLTPMGQVQDTVRALSNAAHRRRDAAYRWHRSTWPAMWATCDGRGENSAPRDAAGLPAEPEWTMAGSWKLASWI